MKNGIFKNYLNAMLKEKKVVYSLFNDGKENMIGFSGDGKVGYFIKKEKFPFNLNYKNAYEFNKLADLYTEGVKTADAPINKTGAMQVIIINNVETEAVQIGSKWIDKRFLKDFDKHIRFTGDNEYFRPVYIWEGDNLAGFIMPLRVKENGYN